VADFFVSYASPDAAWAEWIASILEAADYECIVQAWDFRPGTNFVLEMQRATEAAKRTIGILSKNYFASEFALSEFGAAFARDPQGLSRKFLPIRIEECAPPGLLGQIVYIDLVNRDEFGAKQAILGGIQPQRSRPAVTPKFPRQREVVAAAPPFPGYPATSQGNGIPREELGASLLQQLSSNQSFLIGEAIASSDVLEVARAMELSDRNLLRLIESLCDDGFIRVRWGGYLELSSSGRISR